MATDVDLRELAIDREEQSTLPVARRRHLMARYVLPAALIIGFLLLLVWALRGVLLPATPVTVVPVHVSRAEIQQAGDDLSALVQWGPGYAYQMDNPVIPSWIDRNFVTGVCFRHRSLWPRTDLLSRPELAPAWHGSTGYCETDLVWERRDLAQGFGMFPYFGEPAYFDAPPLDFPGC